MLTEIESSQGLTALVACLLVPLLGPLLQRASIYARPLLALLDGFMLISIAGLVLLDILPHSYKAAGWAIVPMALAGLFVPTLAERLRSHVGRRVHTAALYLAVIGILVHSFVDGAGLVGGASLTMALIFHRLPVGLAVWMLLRRSQGVAVAVAGVALLDLSTVVGFFVARGLEPDLSGAGLGLFAALVAGSLLHVVLHMPAADTRDARDYKMWSAVGAIFAIVLLVVVLGDHYGQPSTSVASRLAASGELHDHSHQARAADLFLHLALKSAPALLLAYLAAGLIFAFLPQASLRWLGAGRGTWSQSVRGMIFGLPLPICSCGIVPIYRSLSLKGVPLAAGLTMLIATPELGIDAVFLSFQFLDASFAFARIGAAAILAVVVGAVIGRIFRDQAAPVSEDIDADRPVSLGERLRTTVATGFGDVVDHTAAWIVVGLGMAALVEPLLSSGWLNSIPPMLEIPAFALIGMPVYVCASGATPLVAVLIAEGVSPGAAIAFLLTGPATNITTFGLLAQLHGRKLAVAFGVAVATMAVVLGLVTNAITPEISTHLEPDHEVSVLQWLSLGLLALVFLTSLFRQGPRGFIAQILSQTSDLPGDHDHGETEAGCCH